MVRRLSIVGLFLALVLSGPSRELSAQANAVVAFCYLDQGQFGGALQPTPTGWQWAMVCAYSNPSTGQKDVVTGVIANTLNGDTLGQVGQKLANGVKADAALHNYVITAVLLPQSVIVTPQ